MTSTTAEVIRNYFGIVGDLASTPDDFLKVIHPDVRIVTHPNLIAPNGNSADATRALASFELGKRILTEQTFEVHEVLVDGDRAAVRATWTGQVAVDGPGFAAGDTLHSEVAAFVMVSEGRVIEHETFDCYAPLGAVSQRT